MPSLNELQEFKASFHNIGGQKANLAAKGVPFDDLELPDSEPKPMTNAAEPDAAAADLAVESSVPSDDSAGADFETAPVDEIDFSAFLGSQPDDLPEPPVADIPVDELYAPEGLLSNLSEELDAIPPDFPEESVAADSGAPSLDLDSLDNFDLPEEPFVADSGERPLDLDSLDNFDLPEEPPAADSGEEPLDLGSLDDLDLPGETAADEEPPAADSGEEPLDLGSLDDLDLPEETAADEEPLAADSEEEPLDLGSLDDLDLPGETAADEEPLAADSGEEPLDLGSFDDLDLSGETAVADDTVGETENLDLDNLGDLNFPEESPAASEEPPAADSGEEPLDRGSFDDLDLPGETAAADDTAGETENFDLDNLDDFNFSAGSPAAGEESFAADGSEDLELDNLDDAVFSGEQGPVDSIDDFSFPELDNVLKRSQEKTTEKADPKKSGKDKRWGKEKKERKKSFSDDDEIQLSDDELEGLQETLSRYPLNLRIACEEIITEQVVNPKQLSELIEYLVWGATAKETAILAGHILGRTITIPKAFEKSTGAALEAEQASFAYIFVHNFLPVLRLFVFIALVAASLSYLLYTFVYTPLKAESIYKIGYERIFDGEYERANERFTEAFNIYRKKNWFYKYAEAFRDERQYIYAEQKYDELLRYYTRDKKGVLDYANLETYYLRNYAKADNILRWQLLDYAPNDPDGLLAAGDNCLIWGDIDPSKYEDARYYYARLLEKYGWKGPVVERMMMYFIRTDNLKEVLTIKNWFDNSPKEKLSAVSLGELGGYLLDKQLEEVRGVPDEYIEHIGSVRELLLEAVYADPSLPEPHYHLARYYHHLGNTHEERVTLRIANRTFDESPEGSIRRLNYRIDAIQRYADVLINDREFFPAEEQLVKGVNLYEDAISRRLISPTPKFGKLYAGLGDLEYFTKVGDMEAALRFYHRSEQHGWAPPEMQYRMGSAYYQLGNWRNALEYLFASSSSLPLNRRILFALGNTALKRGDYFAANGYYNRLLDILDSQRSRLPILLPNDRPEYLELAERLMMAQNNAGVACEMLAAQTGNRSYHTRALAFYAEAARAWDARTRDPRTMIRSGNTPLPFLNSRNALYPQASYEPQIFIRIDREALETSPWEEISPLARIENEGSN